MTAPTKFSDGSPIPMAKIDTRTGDTWTSEGKKHDDGKDPWHLLPWDAVRAIVKILQFGAGKYGPRNWEKGMAWSRCYSALMRHLTSWWEGEKSDPETGYSHLWHAGCCMFFLIAFEIRGVGTDDRPKHDALERLDRSLGEAVQEAARTSRSTRIGPLSTP